MNYVNSICIPIFNNENNSISHVDIRQIVKDLGYNIEGQIIVDIHIKYLILKDAYCNAGDAYLDNNLEVSTCPKDIQLSNSRALAYIPKDLKIRYSIKENGIEGYCTYKCKIDYEYNVRYKSTSINVEARCKENIAGVVVELGFKGDPKIERIVPYDLAPLFNTMQQYLDIPKEVVVLNNKPFNAYSLFGKEVIGGCLKVTKIIVDYVDVKKGDLIYTPDGKIEQAKDDGIAATAVLDVSPKKFITNESDPNILELSFRVKDIDDCPLDAYIDCWFDKKQKVLKCQIRNSDDYFNNDIIGVVVDTSDLKVDKDSSLNAIESRYGGPTIVEEAKKKSELLDQMIAYKIRRKAPSFTLDSLANPEHVKKLDWCHMANSKKNGVKLSKLLLLMHLMNQKNQ